MKQKAYLIVDIGTGNTRAAVISTKGEFLAVSREDSVYYEDHDFPSSIYFKPEEWIRTIHVLIHRAMDQAGDADIIAVSAASQRQGIVLLDREGESVLGFPNSDMRGAEFIDDLDWNTLTEITGLDKDAFYSCMKVRGTQKRQPEIAKRIATYTSISDWIGYLFTGRVVWERSQTAHTLAYDIRSDSWSREMCDLIGMDYEQLPVMALAGTVLGPVKEELIREFGLNPDAKFIVGAADTQLALVGVQAEKGDVVVVNGTTTPITMVIDHYRKFPFWISPHAVAGEYMLELNCGATGINVQRLKDKLLRQYSYEELENAALRKCKVPKMLAMFGEQYNLPDERCTTVGFLFEEEIEMMLEPCDFMQAMNLDVACQIVTNYRHLTNIEPTDKDYMLGCGGGFRSSITAQAIADISGKEVWLPDGFAQSTIYGCVHLCNQAMGMPRIERKLEKRFIQQDNPEVRKYYEKWLTYRGRMRNMNDLSILS